MTYKRNTTPLTVHVPPILHQTIKADCALRSVSMTEEIVALLEDRYLTPRRAEQGNTRPLTFRDCINNVWCERNFVILGNGEKFAVTPGAVGVQILDDGVLIGGHRKYTYEELGTTPEEGKRFIERFGKGGIGDEGI